MYYIIRRNVVLYIIYNIIYSQLFCLYTCNERQCTSSRCLYTSTETKIINNIKKLNKIEKNRRTRQCNEENRYESLKQSENIASRR